MGLTPPSQPSLQLLSVLKSSQSKHNNLLAKLECFSFFMVPSSSWECRGHSRSNIRVLGSGGTGAVWAPVVLRDHQVYTKQCSAGPEGAQSLGSHAFHTFEESPQSTLQFFRVDVFYIISLLPIKYNVLGLER